MYVFFSGNEKKKNLQGIQLLWAGSGARGSFFIFILLIGHLYFAPSPSTALRRIFRKVQTIANTLVSAVLWAQSEREEHNLGRLDS